MMEIQPEAKSIYLIDLVSYYYRLFLFLSTTETTQNLNLQIREHSLTS